MHLQYTISDSPAAAPWNGVGRLPPPPAGAAELRHRRNASPTPLLRTPTNGQDAGARAEQSILSSHPESLPRPPSMKLAQSASHRAEVAAREAGSVAHRLTTRGASQERFLEADDSMASALMVETVAPDIEQGPGGPGVPHTRRLHLDMGMPPTVYSDDRRVQARAFVLPPAPEEKNPSEFVLGRDRSAKSFTELSCRGGGHASSASNGMRSFRQDRTPKRHVDGIDAPLYWDDGGPRVVSPSYPRLPVAPISPGEPHHIWFDRVLQTVEAPPRAATRSLPMPPFQQSESTASSSRDMLSRPSGVGRPPINPKAEDISSSWRRTGGAAAHTGAHALPQAPLALPERQESEGHAPRGPFSPVPSSQRMPTRRQLSLVSLNSEMMHPERRVDGQRPLSPMSLRMAADRGGSGKAVPSMSPHIYNADPDQPLVGRPVSPSAEAPMRLVFLGRPPRVGSQRKDALPPEPCASQQFRPPQRAAAPPAPPDAQVSRGHSVGPPISRTMLGSSRSGSAHGNMGNRSVHWNTRLARGVSRSPPRGL